MKNISRKDLKGLSQQPLVSIKSFKDHWRIKENIETKGVTDVLYLNPIVEFGGAPKAAYRIHQGLCSIGVNSKMLVLESNLSPMENIENEIYIMRPVLGEIFGYHNDTKCLEEYPQRDLTPHMFSPAITGVSIDRYIEAFNPKIIQLHWVNAGLVKIEDLGNIKRKIVWRLPDCWAFTGGCFYSGDCKRYITGCGKCPKLGSDNEKDLSHTTWKRKEEAWKKMDMTIVVPTSWMKKMVKSSTLLKDKDVYVIPNGLNRNRFYPIAKETARKVLKIPLNKKVILYGATNALNDPRKGFELLLQALQCLSEKYKDKYYFVIFGSDPQKIALNIPTLFLGYIHDHHTLQSAYSAADVMVVPSLEEAFGQTVTEAMACATPVVSFLETGPEDMINHKQNGYLAQYANSIDLACGIEWVLSDDQRTKTLSNNARHKVETTYDIKIIAKQYQDLYDQILNK